MIRLSGDLELPVDVLTDTFSIVGKRGSGKSYLAKLLAEGFSKSRLPYVAIDPTGAWWGLRASADGKKPGFPIIVLGGDHGDVPLEPTAGREMADFLVEEQASCILDVLHFSQNNKRKFVCDFAERLYERNKDPLHLFIDEADLFVPQVVFPEVRRTFGAVDEIVRRGRIKGLGVTLICQRSAKINKDVLSQTEFLIALRTTGPHDKKAIRAWIEDNTEAEDIKSFMASLAELKRGEAWIWCPGFRDIFKRIHVSRLSTFDSSATPKVGQKIKAPKTLAEVDLEGLQKRISETIEKAKKDDPRALRHRISELERELSRRPETEPEIKEVSILTEEDRQLLESVESFLSSYTGIDFLISSVDQLTKRLNGLPREGVSLRRSKDRTPYDRGYSFGPSSVTTLKTQEEVKLRDGERRILQALSWRHPIQCTKAQVATLAKLKSRSGTFSSYISNLKTSGLISLREGKYGLTDEGRSWIGEGSPHIPRTRQEFVEMWNASLRRGEREILSYFLEHPLTDISRSELAEATGFSERSGTFSSYVSTLKTNDLILVDNGRYRLNQEIFSPFSL